MNTAVAAQTNGVAHGPLVGFRPKKTSGMPTKGLWVFVGLEKSGKTKTVASAPDSYVFELDPGDADHVDGRIHDIVPVTNEDGGVIKTPLDVFRESYAAALQDDSIRVIGVDTYNKFVALQGQEIAEAAGLKSMTDRKEGVNGYALWDELEHRCTAFIESAKNSGKLVVVTAHCKAPELDEDKHVVIPMGIDSYKKPGSILAKRADLIGYFYKKEIGGAQEYRVSFQGGPLGAWGTRVDELNDKTLKLDKKDPWGSIVAAANGQSKTATAEPAPAKKPGATTKRR